MRIRLYFDEDSARRSLARELRLRGADVVTAPEVGMAGHTDEQQLEWATSNDHVLYSFNRGDFYRLHTRLMQEGKSHSGIVLSKQGLSVGEQMRRLLHLIDGVTFEEMRNRIEFLGSWSAR